MTPFYKQGHQQALFDLGLTKEAGWFSNMWGGGNKQPAPAPQPAAAKTTGTTSYGSRPPGAPAPGRTPPAKNSLTMGGGTNQRAALRREGVFGM